jgi:hypothetical protein
MKHRLKSKLSNYGNVFKKHGSIISIRFHRKDNNNSNKSFKTIQNSICDEFDFYYITIIIIIIEQYE